MYVTLMLDVEDIVDPLADEAARDAARALTAEGVAATFCIVGERARQWRHRGRTDVVEALARHDIGYHTNLHSVHPTPAEYLADRGWADGVQEAVTRDADGVAAVRDLFGVTPSCWGGPGNTWGPQINGALAELGIPSVVYAHTCVPDGDIHRFAGCIAYPGGRHVGDADYHDGTATRRNIARVTEHLAADVGAGRQWVEVFAGHPSRMAHHAFWDGHLFARGRHPPREEWTPAPRKSPAEAAAAMEGMRAAVRAVASLPGVELRTIREMNALAAAGSETHLSEAEQAAAWPIIEANVQGMQSWPILPAGFDTANIRALTRQRLGTLRRIDLHSA